MKKIDNKKIPEVKVPADLRKILSAKSSTENSWNSLTPIARRDFISWVESAKQVETRKSRMERIPSMLSSGKRRPCCYSIVPMNFYKALGSTPQAKQQWSKLTPVERRDFVAWVESVKESDKKRDRVEKACLALASGKRHP